jgi:hypothetical protein
MFSIVYKSKLGSGSVIHAPKIYFVQNYKYLFSSFVS